MNTKLFYYSLAEIGISLVIGVTLLYFTYRILDKYVMQKHNLSHDNISASIFVSSILFSVAYLISDIKSPLLNSLNLNLHHWSPIGGGVFKSHLDKTGNRGGV